MLTHGLEEKAYHKHNHHGRFVADILYVQEQTAVMNDRLANGGEPRLDVDFQGSGLQPASAGSTLGQDLLEGLLQDRPARREAGEDLLGWLEMREQNQLGSAEENLPSSEEMVDIVDGMVNSHQQAAEVSTLSHDPIPLSCSWGGLYVH